MAVAADVVLRRADPRARGRRRDRHERQDDDDVPPPLDPRRGRPRAGPRRHGRVGRRRESRARRRTRRPEAIDLQRLFREMLDAGDRSVAVEASSHGSALHRLDRVRFDALVFTNLSQDHLDLHGTMEDYYQAKRRLFTGAQPPPAAVNVGDEHGRRLALELVGGASGAADHVRARRMRPRSGPRGSSSVPQGSRFAAGGIEIETPLRGRFNVENVLGAIAAGILLDVDEDAIAAGVRGDDGRSRADSRRSTRASRSPSSSTTRTRPTRSTSCCRRPASSAAAALICVFGAGGDRDRGKRPLMGARRRAARRHRDRDLRQPAQRGSARDHPGRPPGRRDRRRDRPRPAHGDPARGRRSRRRATSS